MSQNIIIVDNDPDVRKAYARLVTRLERLGASVVMMDSPTAVLNHVAANGHPDVVLSDNNMDEMDGSDLANALRKGGYEGRFVLLTGLPDEVKVIKEGDIDVILAKPCGATEIVAALQLQTAKVAA